jgi:hypothetical protein
MAIAAERSASASRQFGSLSPEASLSAMLGVQTADEETITRLTDETVALFDRALGHSRHRNSRAGCPDPRDSRAINNKVCLLARL